MSANENDYQVTGQVETKRLDPAGTVSSGVQITVRDLKTLQTFTVFLPDENYSVDNARTQILYKLEQLRQIHDLSN